MTTPIENLRNEHRHCSCWGENCSVKRNPQEDWNSHCFKCAVTWPCDTIAALDALEEGLHNLHARIDAATVLIRQAMEREHYSRHGGVSPSVSAPATCSACASYREWLGGEER